MQTVLSLYGGDSTLIILAFTILSVSLAVIGYDLIHLAQRWIAYVLIAVYVVPLLTIGVWRLWKGGQSEWVTS